MPTMFCSAMPTFTSRSGNRRWNALRLDEPTESLGRRRCAGRRRPAPPASRRTPRGSRTSPSSRPLRSARASARASSASVGTRWCHSTRSSMNETPRPLCVWAMTQLGRPRSSGRALEPLDERREVVAVDLGDGPAEGAPLVGQRLEAHRALGRVALLEAVAVDDDRQVVEAEVRGRHGRFPVAALLQLAVARSGRRSARRARPSSRRAPCRRRSAGRGRAGRCWPRRPGTLLRSGCPLSSESGCMKSSELVARRRSPPRRGSRRARPSSGPC